MLRNDPLGFQTSENNKRFVKEVYDAVSRYRGWGKEVLKGMIQAGLNVVRLNFSHGAHDDHSSVVAFVREIDKELGTNTALLADLQGPKLRVGVMQDNGVMLEAGKQIIITTVRSTRVSPESNKRVSR